MTRNVLSIARLFAVGLVAFVVGCGGSGNRAAVTGKVTANGQPVTEGTLLFSPIASGAEENSAPATAEVQADGTFTAGTDKAGDGAAIGKHRVSYSPPIVTLPEWDGTGKKPEAPQSKFSGFAPKTPEVEITSGTNELTIELAPPQR